MADALTDADLDRMEASTSFHCHAEVQRLVAEVRRLRGVIAARVLIDRSSVGVPALAEEQVRLSERVERLQAENERLVRERREFSDALTRIEHGYPDGIRVVAAALAGDVPPDPAVVTAAVERVRSRVEHDAAELSAARETLDVLNEHVARVGFLADVDHVEHIVRSHSEDVEASYRYLAAKLVEVQAILWKFYEPIVDRMEACASGRTSP